MTLQVDKETHRYTLNGETLISVTQVLECVGLLDTEWFTEWHRWRGTAIHAACHYLDEGTLDWNTVDPRFTGYIAAYDQFKRETGFIPTAIEQHMYSWAWRFAGTPDRIGTLNGRRVLIDLKNVSYSPAYALQTAGYAHLAGIPQGCRFTLHLKDDGQYKLRPHTNLWDLDDFLAALRVTKWKMENLQWKPATY